MRIYFENYPYESDQIKPYLESLVSQDESSTSKYKTEHIGYIFVNVDKYSGPVFILPKLFLIKKNGIHTVLGWEGILPEDVIDTDDENNPLELSTRGTFLPELSLWLYRAINRFRTEHEGTTISRQAELDSQLPEDSKRDKDFLSTALDLIDFLKDHRNLFTQISLINHSGRNKIDWPKTVAGDPFFYNGNAWYLEPAIKEKTINIDDTLIILYYSVLKYLRDKYRFPIDLGEVPYQLLGKTEIQRLIDTGIGSKQMQRIRHKYFRDDLKHLWVLLDSFFTYNTSDEDKNQDKEHLLVKKFNIVFEAMIDSLISDTRGVEDLKQQDDGKLIDHIFRFTSLIGNLSDIYFIGDSKYYSDGNNPEGTALYKQFTYAKNAIQYHIDKLYLKRHSKQSLHSNKNSLRYRDTLTEGYNITPNFFIRSRIAESDINYDRPSLVKDYWDEKCHHENPPTNKHFEDRLFDRDTLILRQFSINLLFVIAAYAGYEDACWSSDLHRTIRNAFIESIDKEYEFFKITPKNISTVAFNRLYTEWLNGKTYTIDEGDNYLIVAFEKSDKGQKDKYNFEIQRLREVDTGESVTYDIEQVSLQSLNQY